MKPWLSLFLVLFTAVALPAEKTDEEIKKILIELSIRSYSGSCPCPYNRARNGSRCGKRSAYSKPRGASPLCYPRDVTEKMIEAYRAKEKGR